MLHLIHHRTAKVWLIVGIAITGLILMVFLAILLVRQATAPRTETVVPPPEPTPSSIEMRLLVMGDIFFGRYINQWSMSSPLQYAYPFQSLGQFERDTYDAWVANLECPVTNNPKLSPAQEEATLQFDCAPEYLVEAKKWFTAVSLANNHTDNQGGLAGLAETREHLEANGMQYFGSFDPRDTDNLCDILTLPVHIRMSDNSIQKGVLPFAWCGYHGVFTTPSMDSIAVVERYAERFAVFAMPHSGAEYQPGPDTIKTTWYRQLIDGGADVVIGNHAHWIQSSEAYNGRLIMYSLGNFIFDQQSSSEVTRSAVLSVVASVEAADAPDIDKWLAFAEQCRAYHDNCLNLAEQQELKKLPLKFHFTVLGSNDSGKVTHRADETQLAAIKHRLGWGTTLAGLTGQNGGE